MTLNSIQRVLRPVAWRVQPLRAPAVKWRARGMGPKDAGIGSYPRSGSTWLRFVLYECLVGQSADFEVVDKTLPGLGAHRDAPGVLRNGGRLIHTHERLRPPGSTAVYLVRDPRAVVLSEYRFNQRRQIPVGTLDEFVRQFIKGRTSPHGSWATCVMYWKSLPRDATHIEFVKYE